MRDTLKQRVVYVLAQECVEQVGLILYVERYIASLLDKGGYSKPQRMSDDFLPLSAEDTQIAQ